LLKPRWLLLVVVGLAAALTGLSGALASGQSPSPNDRPVGFGRATTGGDGRGLYRVTNLDDVGPGSLREGVERAEPTTIEFEVSGTIRPEETLMVGADKTIDGRGRQVTISGRGMTLTQPNVIVRNLFFADVTPSDVLQDAIHIEGARNVWIDHNSMTGAGDKLIGMESGTDVTISWNWFHNQQQVIQLGTFGTADAARDIRVTLHHNLFTDNGYRHPRASYGEVHAFNNYLRNWQVHGMSAVRGAQLASEANIFEAGADRNATVIAGVKNDKDDTPGSIRSVGDLALTGAVVRQNQPERVFDPAASYSYSASPATDALRNQILVEAGVEGAVKPATPNVPTTVPPQRQNRKDNPRNRQPQAPQAAPPPSETPSSDDSDGFPLVPVLVVAGLAAGAAAGAFLVRARMRSGDRPAG